MPNAASLRAHVILRSHAASCCRWNLPHRVGPERRGSGAHSFFVCANCGSLARHTGCQTCPQHILIDCFWRGAEVRRREEPTFRKNVPIPFEHRTTRATGQEVDASQMLFEASADHRPTCSLRLSVNVTGPISSSLSVVSRFSEPRLRVRLCALRCVLPRQDAGLLEGVSGSPSLLHARHARLACLTGGGGSYR